MNLYTKQIPSPVGKLKLVASDDALVAILWDNDKPMRVRLGEMQTRTDHPILLAAEKQLAEYFAEKRSSFDLPIAFHGTDFQKRVWEALEKIPYGKTTTYGDIAKRLNCPKGSRAIGASVGRNPISIIVPCHRVIGASGKLTGFAGGLDRKATLLQLEQKHHSSEQPELIKLT